MMTRTLAVALALLLGATGANDYTQEIEAWRERRLVRLRADDGWLTVVGLYWLAEGTQTIGSAPGSAIVFPEGAPARLGSIELRGEHATLHPDPGSSLQSGGQALKTPLEMRPDKSGSPDLVTDGRFTFFVIERGGRSALRVRDRDSHARREFAGLRWYPIDPAWRIEARWEPAAAERTVAVPTILGTVESTPSPGDAVFEVAGRTYRLSPVLEEKDATELFFIFKDETSGKDTYGAGRFLYTPLPQDGKVVLDFNKAYSPPCAFTDAATCPLPPRQNRLPMRIEAGEQRPVGH